MGTKLLRDATSSSTETTSGYLLDEVVKLSLLSTENCISIERYLLNRLQRDNPTIKLKVLRIFKHLFMKGAPELKQSMKKKSEVIRNYQSFTYPSDPIFGDASAKNVREEATKCMEMLFSEQTPNVMNMQTKQMYTMGMGNMEIMQMKARQQQQQKFNNNIYNDGSDNIQNDNYIKRIQEGRGNVVFDNDYNNYNNNSIYSTAENTFKFISDAAHKYLPGVKDQLYKGAKNIANISGFNSTWNSGMNFNSNTAHSSSIYSLPNAKHVMPETITQRMEPPIRSGNEYEAKLVDDILAPGGVKASPPSTVLKEFVRKCGSLDIEIIANLLFERYSNTHTTSTTKQRALTVVEALLTSTTPQMMRQKDALKSIIKTRYSGQLNKDKDNTALKGKALDVLYHAGLTKTRSQKSKKIDASIDLLNEVDASIAAVNTTSSSINDFLGFDETAADMDSLEFFHSSPRQASAGQFGSEADTKDDTMDLFFAAPSSYDTKTADDCNTKKTESLFNISSFDVSHETSNKSPPSSLLTSSKLSPVLSDSDLLFDISADKINNKINDTSNLDTIFNSLDDKIGTKREDAFDLLKENSFL